MNTKRLTLVVSSTCLAALLPACAGTAADAESSSIEPEKVVLTDGMIADLAKGYSLETTMKEDVDGKATYSLLETQVLDGKLHLATYEKAASPEEASKDRATFRETYYRSEEGMVTTRRIGLDNAPKYYEVIAPDGSDVYSWEETGYANAFSSLKAEDFVAEGNGWFTLDLSALPAQVSTALMTGVYGTLGLNSTPSP